jgi:tRNA (cytidine32/uridine32-2'-O)-methyltransferase
VNAPRIVLVRTSHPGNIGAAARAMRTMGLAELALVEPRAHPHPDSVAMAANAVEVLEAARVHRSLDEAVADCRFVVGTSARPRGVALPVLDPRAAVAALREHAGDGAVALVFGNERTGLTNDELHRCHAAVQIPADPAYSSLNLAAAVQVLAYEWRVATSTGNDARRPGREAEPAADKAQVEGFFAHLDATLAQIDFYKGRAPHTILRRLRRLFLRAEPSEREVLILRGILSDVQRTARLASLAPHGGARVEPGGPDPGAD